MSKQETVKYTIKQNGNVTAEIYGVTGNQCLEVTKSVEDELGTVLTREFSPAFYESEPVEEYVHTSEGC